MPLGSPYLLLVVDGGLLWGGGGEGSRVGGRDHFGLNLKWIKIINTIEKEIVKKIIWIIYIKHKD